MILVAFSGVFVFGSRWKPGAARQLLNTLEWTGAEVVLDVGCGRGLWLVEAAKHLTTGRAVGVDVWNKWLQSGNSPENALENAKIAGVADRVKVRYGDARELPFADETFDVVVSSLVIHHVPAKERRKVLLEIVRVLKPGGRLAILEIFGEVARYDKVIRDAGISDVKMSWVRGGMVFGVRTLVGTNVGTRADPSSGVR